MMRATVPCLGVILGASSSQLPIKYKMACLMKRWLAFNWEAAPRRSSCQKPIKLLVDGSQWTLCTQLQYIEVLWLPEIHHAILHKQQPSDWTTNGTESSSLTQHSIIGFANYKLKTIFQQLYFIDNLYNITVSIRLLKRIIFNNN